jgi:hypothetical protein
MNFLGGRRRHFCRPEDSQNWFSVYHLGRDLHSFRRGFGDLRGLPYESIPLQSLTVVMV